MYGYTRYTSTSICANQKFQIARVSVEEGDYSLWSNKLRLTVDKITTLAQNRLSINDAGLVAEVPREWDEMYSPFATGPQFRATSGGSRRADEFLELVQVYTWEEYSDELAIGLQVQPVCCSVNCISEGHSVSSQKAIFN